MEISQQSSFLYQGIDPSHLLLKSHGISKETAQEFGVGYFSGKGSMAGRVVIPIHDECGQLVAYAGRSVDGSEATFKFSAGFQKSAVLYNIHRVLQCSPINPVIVLEDPLDCLRIWQLGHLCVSSIGRVLSPQQEHLLSTHFLQVILFLRESTKRDASVLQLSKKGLWVRVADFLNGKNLSDLSDSDIQSILTSVDFIPEVFVL